MRQVEDDRALFARAAHDVEAFEALYRRYVGRVTAYAATRCSGAADVADVVALTFVRLLERIGRYDPERGEPVAFVIAIARGVVGDHHRKVARDRRLVRRLSGRDLLGPDETERIEAAIDAAAQAHASRHAIDRVSAGEKAVFDLVVGGASPSEAAAELGIPANSARVRLHRARRRVRSNLSDPSSLTSPKEA